MRLEPAASAVRRIAYNEKYFYLAQLWRAHAQIQSVAITVIAKPWTIEVEPLEVVRPRPGADWNKWKESKFPFLPFVLMEDLCPAQPV